MCADHRDTLRGCNGIFLARFGCTDEDDTTVALGENVFYAPSMPLMKWLKAADENASGTTHGKTLSRISHDVALGDRHRAGLHYGIHVLDNTLSIAKMFHDSMFHPANLCA